MSLFTRPQTIKTALICLLAFLFTACSAVRFVYNQGDTLVRWWMDDHIGFTSEQDTFAREFLERQFWWHRTEQLQEISFSLEQIRDKISRPMSTHEINQFSDQFKKYAYSIANKATPDVAKLFISLQPSQIEAMQKRMQKGNDKFIKEWLPKEKEKQIQVRADKVIERTEWLFGTLSKEQEQKIRDHIIANPLDMNAVFQDRLRRQNDLILMAKEIQAKRLSQTQAEELIKNYIKNFEYGHTPEQRSFAKNRADIGIKLASFVTQTVNDEQRKYAKGRVDTWVADVQELIRESSVLAAKRSALQNR
jgi:hypothetical protein